MRTAELENEIADLAVKANPHIKVTVRFGGLPNSANFQRVNTVGDLTHLHFQIDNLA